jgi:hypothetical protein
MSLSRDLYTIARLDWMNELFPQVPSPEATIRLRLLESD